MMINQFVCLLFVYLLLNQLLSSYLVMGQRRKIKYLYLLPLSSWGIIFVHESQLLSCIHSLVQLHTIRRYTTSMT